jgi:hypothetical protein
MNFASDRVISMPQDRRQSCRYDYEDAKNSWNLVLNMHRRSADQPNSPVVVVHAEGNGKLDAFARSFRSIGLMEALAAYVLSRYVLPCPITLAMKSCGDANAWWDPPTRTGTLCYELTEDFVELYQGYTLPYRACRAQRLRWRRGGHSTGTAADPVEIGSAKPIGGQGQ